VQLACYVISSKDSKVEFYTTTQLDEKLHSCFVVGVVHVLVPRGRLLCQQQHEDRAVFSEEGEAHELVGQRDSAMRLGDAGGGFVHAVFFDPPWGGPNYEQIVADHMGDIPLSPAPRGVAYTGVRDWILSACGLRHSLPLAPVVAFKLPACFDVTSLARELTLRPPSRAVSVEADRERCFPFRFHFGRSTILFVVAVAGTLSLFSCTAPEWGRGRYCRLA
jgi:hypothetical protein